MSNTPRFPVIAPDDMTEAQRAVASEISAGPRGSVRGPFIALLHNPELARRVQAVGEHLRFNTEFAPDMTEFVVLIAARLWNCQFEWFAHERIARTTSLAPSIIDALARGEKPEGMSKDQAHVYAFCLEMHNGGEASDQNFSYVEQAFGKAGALNLIALCGYYSMLAMILNTARLPLPDGAAPPLKPVSGRLPA